MRKLVSITLISLLFSVMVFAAGSSVDMGTVSSPTAVQFLASTIYGIDAVSGNAKMSPYFTVTCEGARRVAFTSWGQDTQAAAPAGVFGTATVFVSMNDSIWTDASTIGTLTVNDNLSGVSAKNGGGTIEVIASGAGRINFKRACIRMSQPVGGTIDSVRSQVKVQYD